MQQKVLFIFALLCTVAQGAGANNIDLSQVTADVTAQNGDVLTGTTSEYKVTIARGATVTLSGVTISTGAANSYCIQCAGTATIILAQGTTNTLTCTGNYSTALRPGGTGTTLTIQGTGTLKAQSGEKSAGIGAVSDAGGGGTASCGDIVIEGGTIEAKGGSYSAGIGSTWNRSCGSITIASSVKCVSATKGSGAAHCIGNGYATCGTVTIGGVVYWDGYDYQNYGADYIDQDELNIAFINSGAVDVPAGKYYNVIGTKEVTGNKITIGDGATVALSNVNIQKENDYCVKCEGSATIILKYNTVNELTSSGAAPSGYPALWVGGSGTKLTIQSEIDWYQFTGKLIAQGADRCAAIGGGVHKADHTCGDIEIQGGIITATGGICAPAIGSGFGGSCGSITITSGVTRVTAKTPIHTSDNSIDCIGRGNAGTCGTVTIGGMVFYDGSTYKNHGDDYIARRELSVACINTATVEVNDGEFCLIFGNGNATDHAFSLTGSSTAVLSNVHIERTDGCCVTCYQNNPSYITLKDETTNKLISTRDNALRVGDAGTTLIINGESAGTGKLVAQGGAGHAAIGGGTSNTGSTCGNIQILGGIIEAKGGSDAPAIGADNGCMCGTITIHGLTSFFVTKGDGATYDIGCSTGTIEPPYYYIPFVDEADNSTRISDFNSKASDVTLYGRTLYKDGAWNTLCLPFHLEDGDDTDDITFTGTPLEGATVKTLESASFNEESGELTLNFTENSLTAIEAGKPYIVKWELGDNISNPNFSNVTISSTTPTDITPNGEGSDGSVTFKGSFNPVTIGEGGDNTKLYLGSRNTLYWPNAEMNINAFRAYFQLNGITAGDLPGSVKAFNLNFGEERPTLVSLPSGREAAGEWYDLGGRKLDGKPSSPGVFIYKGIKRVVK